MSGDSEQGYFSDGITDDIITQLSRFKETSVTDRHWSIRGKND
jgi:TolB-like protein